MNSLNSMENHIRAKKMCNYVLHVGMPKTGSTAIQRLLFSQHPQISFFTLKSNGGDASCQAEFESFAERVISQDDTVFNYEKEIQFANNQIHPSSADSQCVLVSIEGFTGRFGAGIGLKALRLKKLFPDYKVLIVIRQPLDLLASQYTQTATNMGRRPFFYGLPSYQNWLLEGLENPDHPLSPILSIQVDKIAMLYAGLFGKENVKVMMFEQFKYQPSDFITELAEFMAINANTARSIFYSKNKAINTRSSIDKIVQQQISSNILVKQLPKSAQKYLAKIVRVTANKEKYYTYVDKELENRILSFARPEYISLAKKWNLDIERCGYSF